MPVLFFGHRKHMLDPGDDVLAWGESLEHLLQSKTGQLLFEDFLRTEYSEENLLFWLACEDYKTITSQAEMRVAAKNIYEEFVQVDAPRQEASDPESLSCSRDGTMALKSELESTQA
ncbi:regulator of G-protein signaling 5-like isoform 5-T5 [Spinachia spinachia]